MARCRRANDGRATQQPEVHERFSRRPGLVMQFEFSTSNRIVFGAGKLRAAGALAKTSGRRPLIVTGKNPLRAEPLLKVLRENGLTYCIFSVPNEPEIQTIRDAVEFAKTGNCDWVIAVGGGSALDAGKATAAMMTNEGDVLDYLEIIGHGKALERM